MDKIAVWLEEDDLFAAIQALNAHYEADAVSFVVEASPVKASIYLTYRESKTTFPSGQVVITRGKENEAFFALQSLVSSGFLLPIPEVVGAIETLVTDFEDGWTRFCAGKKVPYKWESRTEDYAGSVPANVSIMFRDHTERTLPELARRLKQRGRRIQRKRDNYFSLLPRIPRDESIYGHLVKTAVEHTARLEELKPAFAELGIKLSPANLSYTQMNIGLPFFGGFNRKAQGFTSPPAEFVANAALAARFMTAGLRAALEEIDPSALTTRATVKVDSFQGAPTMSNNHLVLQSCWKYMAMHPKGIFAFEDNTFPTVIGFRLSDPGSDGAEGAKRRRAFFVERNGLVGLDRVLDGPDFPEDPHWGARVRHVDNPSALQNNAFAPIISYMSDHKGFAYKLLFQQDPEHLNIRLPGSVEHHDFWLDCWHACPWWLEKFKKREKISSFENFYEYLMRIGEYPSAGDVENFDGNTTWEVASPFYEALLQPRLVSLLKKQWNAPSVGTYIDGEGQELWYLIDKTDAATAELADHFNSGQQLTSVGGRGVMTSLLLGFDQQLLRKAGAPGEDIARIFDGSGDPFQPFLYSCAEGGDDHGRFFALYHLLTGVSIPQLRDWYLEIQESCSTYRIAPEIPPVVCGFVLRTDETGLLQSITLSEKRMVSNTVFPEYAKSAIGLDASLRHYCALSEGSVAETVTAQAADLVEHDVYEFSDELLAAAIEEDEIAIEQEALSGSAQLLIAEMLGVSPSLLDYHYSWDALLELGVPEELLERWRQPIPSELCYDPRRFFSDEALALKGLS